MRKFKLSSLALVMLMLATLLLSVSPVEAQVAEPVAVKAKVVNSPASPKYFPRTDGKTVVWMDNRAGSSDKPNFDIYAASVSDNQEFAVATGELDQRNPVIAGDFVIWQQGQTVCTTGQSDIVRATIIDKCGNRDIYAKNLATGQVFAVANTAVDEADPAIVNDKVVWFSKNETDQYSILERNIRTLSPAITLSQLKQPPTAPPSIDGEAVTWIERAISGGEWSVYNQYLGQPSPRLIDKGEATTQGPFGLDTYNNTAVYGLLLKNPTRWIVRSISLTSTNSVDIVTGSLPNFSPVIDGRFFFSEQLSGAGPAATNDIIGTDGKTGTQLIVKQPDKSNYSPDLRDGVLVWTQKERGSNGNGNIFIARLSDTVKDQNPTIKAITAQVSPKYQTRTDGKTVVWTDTRDKDNNYNSKPQPDIYAARLPDGKEFAVANDELDQRNPAVSGDIVVWQQGPSCSNSVPNSPSASITSNDCGNRDIYAKNLATGQVFAVAATPVDEADPAISGSWVVWYSKTEAGKYILQGRDLNSSTPATTLAELNYPPSDIASVDSTNVAWVQRPYPEKRWQLFSRPLLGQASPTVFDEGESPQNPGTMDMQNGIAVYTVYIQDTDPAKSTFEFRATNINTRERRVIVRGTPPPFRSTTDGRYVVWERPTNASPSGIYDLLGFDLATGTSFKVVVGDELNLSPTLRNGVLVWLNKARQNPNGTVYTTKVADLIAATVPPPTTPVAPPTSPNPNVTYFPQTGHNLAYGFKYFWENNGGLPVFGYPQTEEFIETNPDKQKDFTVQYFERQRYEYHPENKGTPYETELGRLGADAAQRLNLTTTAPFQPVADNRTQNCQYFAETKHSVCGTFLTYWQTHGLEFGDAGTSYREALALFGLPLSQEYKDPTTGFTIQYFERAVFEYHPENKGTPYEVLLHRLGSDLLTQRGWLKQ